MFFISKRANKNARVVKPTPSRGEEGCPISGTEAVVAVEGEGEGEGIISKARINLEKTCWETISVRSSRCGN